MCYIQKKIEIAVVRPLLSHLYFCSTQEKFVSVDVSLTISSQ